MFLGSVAWEETHSFESFGQSGMPVTSHTICINAFQLLHHRFLNLLLFASSQVLQLHTFNRANCVDPTLR